MVSKLRRWLDSAGRLPGRAADGLDGRVREVLADRNGRLLVVVILLLLLFLCLCSCFGIYVASRDPQPDGETRTAQQETALDLVPDQPTQQPTQTPYPTPTPLPTATIATQAEASSPTPVPTYTALPTYTPHPTLAQPTVEEAEDSGEAGQEESGAQTNEDTSWGTGILAVLETAKVVRITDGDTIVVEIEGREEALRYIGIDCPECASEDSEMADLATQANAALVRDKVVRLERDVSERDRFGRLLRYVWVGDLMVNAELVRQGMAISKAYAPDTSKQDLLDEAEEKARLAGRGVWKPSTATSEPTETPNLTLTPNPAPTLTPAADETTRSSDLGILDVATVEICGFRPKSKPEEITICNTGSQAVDLTGWFIRSVTGGQEYAFPNGYILGPGEQVTVYSYTGTRPSGTKHLDWTNKPMWNNKGDPAELYSGPNDFVDSVQ